MSPAPDAPPEGYVQSVLDTDLYKLTMQRAVLETFPEVNVTYRFTNRGEQRFTKKVHEAVLKAVNRESQSLLGSKTSLESSTRARLLVVAGFLRILCFI